MARAAVVLGLFVLSCGRTEPVRPGPEVPTYPCELTVAPRALDFGGLAPGERATRALEVVNVGDGLCALERLTVSDADPTFGVEGPAWPRVLGPDERLTMTVTFSAGPAALPVERTGTLEVHTDDALEPRVDVALSARVNFCTLTASPSPLDLGNVGLNLTANGRVTLVNEGSVACEVREVALEAGSDVNFSLPSQPSGFTLAPGASGQVPVRFSARDSAPPHLRTAVLGFSSNDAVTPRGRVPLSAFVSTECTEAGQYIYTVDQDGRFARFDPTTLTYRDITHLNCPTASTPFSMNVDQSAVAWIIFADGNLFRVDTATGACSATSYVPNQLGFFTYGMGSRFDAATGTDTLFLASPDSVLGTLSFPSLTVRRIGTFPLSSVELAGTGDGQLWAFSPPNGAIAELARLDPQTAAVLERYRLPTVDSTGGWAIKFFGGAFYLFIGPDIWRVNRSSLDPSQPEPRTPPVKVLSSPGRDIVGAGVSTCAPTQ